MSGGAGGIGRRLSVALAGVGARVAVLGRSAGQATDLASDIEKLGSEALLVSADVTKRAEADRAIDEVLAPGGKHQQCLGFSVHGLARVKQKLAQRLAEASSSRLTRYHHGFTPVAQDLFEPLQVSTFTGTVYSFKSDEFSSVGFRNRHFPIGGNPPSNLHLPSLAYTCRWQ